MPDLSSLQSFAVFLVGLLTLSAPLPAPAAPPPPAPTPALTVTRLEYRRAAPDTSADAFAAKPKVFSRAGASFGRVEEQPDPAMGLQGLIVCSEPDIWMINLLARTGQHVTDPGPTFDFHAPILEETAAPEFKDLEFGREAEFFARHPAATAAAPAEAEFAQGAWRVVLHTDPATHQPARLEAFKDGREQFIIHYLRYETGLPFDPALFQPPPGVTLTEGKASAGPVAPPMPPTVPVARDDGPAADDGQWMMGYYRHPDLDEVARRLPAWQRQGLLAKESTQPGCVGFLYRLMRDHPERAVSWLKVAEGFPAADRRAVQTAAWLSGAPPARDYFKANGPQALAEKVPPDPFAGPVDNPSAEDFAWAVYFASGDPAAVRRVVSALGLYKDFGALDRYKASQHTEADKKAAMNDAVFKAALWSLNSNAQRDERVRGVCRDLLASGQLTDPEKKYLALILSKVKAEGPE